jgi:uncharacterized repeat protein (TIGR02543 family)
LTSAYVFTTMPAADITLYAKWTAESHSIFFESNGGSAVTTITQEIDTAVSAPTPPTKAGYSFAGWFSDVGLTSAYVFTTMPATDITLYAKWTAESHSISFNSNGGTAVSPITQDTGTVVTAPTPPTRTGYTFAGWFSDVGLTSSYTFTTMPVADITLYAKWTSNAPAAITSTSFRVNASAGTLSGIATGTTIAQLVAGVDQGAFVHIFKGAVEVTGTTLLGTGMVIRLMDGATVTQSLNIVVTGDVSGDGRITLTDFVQMKSHILGKTSFTGTYAIAADLNGDTRITLTDFVKMKSHLLGITLVTPLSKVNGGSVNEEDSSGSAPVPDSGAIQLSSVSRAAGDECDGPDIDPSWKYVDGIGHDEWYWAQRRSGSNPV